MDRMSESSKGSIECKEISKKGVNEAEDFTDSCNSERRFRDLVNHNECLENRIHNLQVKLNDANVSLGNFEQKFMKQVENEEKMKKIVKKMEDYVYSCDEELVDLQEEVSKLQAFNEKNEKEREFQESLVKELKDNQRKILEENTILRKQIEFHQSGQLKHCECDLKIGYFIAEQEKLAKEKSALEQKLNRVISESSTKSKQIFELTECNRKLNSDHSYLQEKLSDASACKSNTEALLAAKEADLNAMDFEFQSCKKDLADARKLLCKREKQRNVIQEQMKSAFLVKEKTEDEYRTLQCEFGNAEITITNLQKQIGALKCMSEKCEMELKTRNEEIVSLKREFELKKNCCEKLTEDGKILAFRLENSEASVSRLEKEIDNAREDDYQQRVQLECKQNEIEALLIGKENQEKECKKIKEEKLAIVRNLEDLRTRLNEALAKRKMDEEEGKRSTCKIEELQLKCDTLERMLRGKEDENSHFQMATKGEKIEATKMLKKLKKKIEKMRDDEIIYKERISHCEEERKNMNEKFEEELKKKNECVERLEEELIMKNNEISQFNSELSIVKKKLEEVEADRKNFSQSLTKKSKEMADAMKRITDLENEENNLRTRIEIAEDHSDDTSKKNGELHLLNEELQTHCENCKRELEELKKINEDKDDLITKGKKHMQSLIANNNVLQSQLNQKHDVLLENENENRQLKADLDALNHKLAVAEDERVTTKAEMQQQKNIASRYLECITDLERKLQYSQAEVTKLQDDYSKVCFEKDSLNIDIDDLKKSLERLREDEKEMKKRVSERDSENQKIKTEYDQLNLGMKMKEEELCSASTKIEILRNEKVDLVEKINSFTANKSVLDCQLGRVEEELAIVKKDLQKSEKQIKELSAKLQVAEDECVEVKKKLQSQENAIKEKSQQNEELENCKESLQNDNSQLQMKLKECTQNVAELESSTNNLRHENKQIVDERKALEEQDNELRNSLSIREEQLKKIVEECNNLSKELAALKKTHKHTLACMVDQKYHFEEVSGSHEFERKQRKMYAKEAEAKEEELRAIKERLVVSDKEALSLKALIVHAEAEKEELKGRIAKYREEFNSLKSENSTLVKEKQIMAGNYEEDIAYLHSCLFGNRREINDLKLHLQEMKKICEEERMTCNELKNVNNKLKKEIESHQENSQQEIASRKNLQKCLTSEKNAKDTLKEMLSCAEDKLVVKEEESRSIVSMLKCAESKIEKLKNDILTLERRIRYLETAKESTQDEMKERELYARRIEAELRERCSKETCLLDKLKSVKFELNKSLHDKEMVEEEKHRVELKLLNFSFVPQNKDSHTTRQKITRQNAFGFNTANSEFPNSRMNESKKKIVKLFGDVDDSSAADDSSSSTFGNEKDFLSKNEKQHKSRSSECLVACYKRFV